MYFKTVDYYLNLYGYGKHTISDSTYIKIIIDETDKPFVIFYDSNTGLWSRTDGPALITTEISPYSWYIQHEDISDHVEDYMEQNGITYETIDETDMFMLPILIIHEPPDLMVQYIFGIKKTRMVNV